MCVPPDSVCVCVCVCVCVACLAHRLSQALSAVHAFAWEFIEDAFKSVIPDGESAYGGLYVNIGAIMDKVRQTE